MTSASLFDQEPVVLANCPSCGHAVDGHYAEHDLTLCRYPGCDCGVRPGLARRADPETSRDAAADPKAQVKWGTDRHKLLLAYARADGPMLDEIAEEKAGTRSLNHAPRCSELRRMGLIEPTGEKAKTASGKMAMVCRITERGRLAIGSLRRASYAGLHGEHSI